MTEPAKLHVLVTGSVSPQTYSTCSLVIDGEQLIVVDPGLSDGQGAIVSPLWEHGIEPKDVTDVVISHHHPDHAINVGLFPEARVHDHWAIYDFRGRWESVDCEGRQVSPSVRLIKTPGHSPEDLSTVVETERGVYVATHAWWNAEEPVDDPYCVDLQTLRDSRARILELADFIVPGHGAPFRPNASTPR